MVCPVANHVNVKAVELAKLFSENFKGFERVSVDVAGAGPKR